MADHNEKKEYAPEHVEKGTEKAVAMNLVENPLRVGHTVLIHMVV
jgi:hydrogenase maturation factor